MSLANFSRPDAFQRRADRLGASLHVRLQDDDEFLDRARGNLGEQAIERHVAARRQHAAGNRAVLRPTGVRKEVAGGADRRNKQPLGHALATMETRLTTRPSGALGKR